LEQRLGISVANSFLRALDETAIADLAIADLLEVSDA
jgi:hypothetical protein